MISPLECGPGTFRGPDSMLRVKDSSICVSVLMRQTPDPDQAEQAELKDCVGD